MPKYICMVESIQRWTNIKVEADNREEAKNQAKMMSACMPSDEDQDLETTVELAPGEME